MGAVRARAVVLATGGMGQVYASTTNPDVSTGDGVAVAARAGAALADLEFVQFHPTALWSGPGATGRQPLVTEALRGEGGVLLDERGSPDRIVGLPIETDDSAAEPGSSKDLASRIAAMVRSAAGPGPRSAAG